MKTLAERLDALRTAEGALVRESEQLLIVSGLSSGIVAEIVGQLGALGWGHEIQDENEGVWDLADLRDGFGLFAIHVQKPVSPDGVVRVVTNTAFAAWLSEQKAFNHWEVARLGRPIETLGVRFSPWGETQPFQPAPPLRSPRELVKESGVTRRVPLDVRAWLISPNLVLDWDDPATITWANVASVFLMRALANEVGDEIGELRFRGPPRVRLNAPVGEAARVLEAEGFLSLQIAARWAFDNPRDTEVKQYLISMEIARASVGREESAETFRDVIEGAFESAKIAFQLSLSDISRDSLKALADLRKAVSDEVGKVSDTTRQIITAAIGSVAVSGGLVAARLTANLNTGLLISIGVVAFLYVCATAYSGHQYLRIQADLRSNWRPRLYNFLVDVEYNRMVRDPMRRAENYFYISGGLSVLICLSFLVSIVVLSAKN